MIPKTVNDCWLIAISEAERYRLMVTESTSGVDRIKYSAKRDASARIARLIRFGTTEVGR